MKKILIWLLKIGVSAGILGYLSYTAWQNKDFERLLQEPKHWGFLAGAFMAALAAMFVTHIRWFLLVRALDVQFALRDAVRLGFIGHLFTFLTLGIVGGDLLKAIFICHEQPQRKTEAVASIIIDRVIGLYALFVMASVAYFASDLSQPEVLVVCHATIGLAIAGTVGLGLMLVPGFTELALWKSLAKAPLIGKLSERAISAVRMYRQKPGVLCFSLLLSLGVHAFSTVSIYFVARGLPGEIPSLGTHFVMVPIAMVANAIPLPGGLGALEGTLTFLYQGVAGAGADIRGGFMVALGYRLITVLLALIGVVYYIAGRRQVEALIHEAEEAPPDDALAGSPAPAKGVANPLGQTCAS